MGFVDEGCDAAGRFGRTTVVFAGAGISGFLWLR
jgi:hypothetical protein